MYMLTLKDRTTDGAYAIADKNGDKFFLCLKKVMMLKDMLVSRMMKNMIMKWLLSKLMMNLL